MKGKPRLRTLLQKLIDLSDSYDGYGSKDCPECGSELGTSTSTGDGFMFHVPCDCGERRKSFWDAFKLYRKVRKQEQEFDEFIEQNHIGPRLGAASFEGWECYGTIHEQERQKKAFNICRAYANHFDSHTEQWLILAGSCGTGKGHLAMSIMREIVGKGEGPCRFIGMDRLFIDLNDTYRKDSPISTKKYLDALCEVRLLTIDDLGRNININEHVRGRLFTIINTRNQNMLPTIFTTNMLPKDDDNPERSTLKKVLGQANYERIFDKTTDNLYVPFEWRSYREKK